MDCPQCGSVSHIKDKDDNRDGTLSLQMECDTELCPYFWVKVQFLHYEDLKPGNVVWWKDPTSGDSYKVRVVKMSDEDPIVQFRDFPDHPINNQMYHARTAFKTTLWDLGPDPA